MAALGQMVLDGGAWDGAQVVSAAWVEQSADRATEFVDGTGYGYQWWLGREDGARQSMAAWGYGGQFIVAIPGLDMVMVSTAENYGGGGFDPYALAEVAYQAAGRAPP
jgi:CubicO group peptidase (beta-lactamase class C family)